MFSYKTNSSKQTQKLAAELAKKILKKRGKKSALVFALKGDLGSGKTTFTQGFLRALGVKKKITSPTFVLMKKFQIPRLRQGFGGQASTKFSRYARPREARQTNSKFQNFKNAYHLDCYRIRAARELSVLGVKEIFKNPQNIILIEWPERIRRILPKNTIWLKFEHGDKENQRIIKY